MGHVIRRKRPAQEFPQGIEKNPAAQTEEKRAVQSGYWHLFRFDPRREAEGLNPFQLDSKEPTESYKDFIMSEVRYNRLARANPERAEELFAQAETIAEKKYEHLAKLASFEDAT